MRGPVGGQAHRTCSWITLPANIPASGISAVPTRHRSWSCSEYTCVLSLRGWKPQPSTMLTCAMSGAVSRVSGWDDCGQHSARTEHSLEAFSNQLLQRPLHEGHLEHGAIVQVRSRHGAVERDKQHPPKPPAQAPGRPGARAAA